MSKVISKKSRFISEYLTLVEKEVLFNSSSKIYYSIRVKNYTCAIVRTVSDKFILVKQFRPAVEDETIEIIAGAIDEGETPLLNIKKELFEEAGYDCEESNITFLGKLKPDTGRHENVMHCFYIDRAKKTNKPWNKEEGIEPFLVSQNEFFDFVKNGKIDHALHLAAITLATLKGKLSIN